LASLYQSTIRARKILFIILSFFAFVLLYNLYSNLTAKEDLIGEAEANRFFMIADAAFGEVPAPGFNGMTYNSDAQFRLNSVHPSTFPDVSYVYKIEQPREKLLSFENALNTVVKLGFIREGYTELDENTFRWQKDNNSKTLEYNKELQSWKFRTEYYENESALQVKTLYETIERYINTSGNLISSLNFLVFGMEKATIEARFAKLGLDGVFVDSPTATESDYVFMNYFRKLPQADLKPKEILPQVEDETLIPLPAEGRVYSRDPRFGQIKIIISNRLNDLTRDIFEIDFTDFEYSTIKASYFIVTPDEAFDLIQRGNGSLVFVQPQGINYLAPGLSTGNTEVVEFVLDAKRTELGYFEPAEWTGYVTPIYIFKGSATLKDGRQANVVIYVDAIKRIT
jgi:hypothetical protein